jgi:predicted permease
MTALLHDIRFGIRMLFKHPGATVIAVLALTLGIGLTTMMFSIVDGAVIEGLPFEKPDQLMFIARSNPSRDIPQMSVTVHDFVDWREQQTSFDGLAGYFSGTVNVSGIEDRPERYQGGFVTTNLFDVLRVQAVQGRTFLEEDGRPGAPPVMILGYGVWRNRFNSDPGIIGATVRTNGRPTTIIGVMPEGFAFPLIQEVWIPILMDPGITRGDGRAFNTPATVTSATRGVPLVGRIRDGVSQDQAFAELTGIARRLEIEYPETNEGIRPYMKPFTRQIIGDEVSRLLLTMLGAVFGVLLIACANVANLLLARAAVRTKEVAVRIALGASRARVISQHLAEAAVLAAFGAALGVVMAYYGTDLFNDAIEVADPPFWIDINVDGTVLLFVLAVTVLATLAAGSLPAIQASGGNVGDVLKDEARGSSSLRLGRFSRGLVAAEIALSCGLLVAAGLMIKTVVKLRTVDFGFQTENIFTARIGLFETDYPDAASQVQFFEQLQERLEAKPGVVAATFTSAFPGVGAGMPRLAIEGEAYTDDRDYPRARQVVTAPQYFETFGVSILQGRDFTFADNAEALPVGIVNESFASQFFSGATPVGRRIRPGASNSQQPWMTIIAVVPDMYLGGPNNEEPQGFYIPLAQNPARFMSIAMRTEVAAMGLATMVRDEVSAMDSNLPIYWVRTLEDTMDANTFFFGVFGTLFMIFGFVSLFLASVGLYGVMAFSVNRRTQEIGLRMALGADAAKVVRLILKQGLWQLGVGLVVGLGLGAVLSRMIRIVLFQVEPWDPTIFAAIVVALVLAGLLACSVPAKRATRIDPMDAMRYE